MSVSEITNLTKELTYPGFKVYVHLLSTYTHEWQKYNLRDIAVQLDISKTTVHRGLSDLVEKQYIKTKVSEKLTAISIQAHRSRSETIQEQHCSESETMEFPIRNIKRERVYYFIFINIIFLFLDKDNILSLSDIPYKGQNIVPDLKQFEDIVPDLKQSYKIQGETEENTNQLKLYKQKRYIVNEIQQIYSLNEEFYEKLQDIGIRVNDKLKAQLDYVGAEEVTEIYDRIMWDEAIRKPSTIFLKEVGKVAREKRKAEVENGKHASNYLTWAGSREFSLTQIYDQCKSFKNWSKEGIIGEWKKRSSYFGYTEPEMNLFQREVIEKELGEEKSDLED